MRVYLLATVAAIGLAAGSAAAQAPLERSPAGPETPSAPSDEGGRYELERAEDGFIRLDTQTGDVSTCTSRTQGWVCEAVPDDRDALETEIARLSEENADLRSRVEGAATGEGGAMPELRRDENGRPTVELTLPSQEDVDKVVGFFGQVMQRFLEMVQNLREQVEAEDTSRS